MRSAILKKLVAFVVPEGLLVIAAVALVRWGFRPAVLAGFARFYPWAVLAAGLLLAWRFQRSRLLFALVALALADGALLRFGPPPGHATTVGTGRLVYHAVALLLPLNLAAIALLPERGSLTPSGLRRWAAIVAQVGLIVLLARTVPASAADILRFRLLPSSFSVWTPLAQPALLAFGVTLALVAAAWVWEPGAGAMKRGFLWALVASFLALHAYRNAPASTLYFATAGLVLVIAVVETSYLMAYRDGLTELPARRALNEALLRLERQYVVAMVDVDHFKDFNDGYGHDVGDQVLRMVAASLAQVGGGGEAFRYGGEEFAVLFPDTTVEATLPHLEELRLTVEATRFTVRGRVRPRKKPAKPKAGRKRRKQFAITVSIGVAGRDARHATPDQVIAAADRALYRAKSAGRNRVRT